jgi:hypothetical protein
VEAREQCGSEEVDSSWFWIQLRKVQRQGREGVGQVPALSKLLVY